MSDFREEIATSILNEVDDAMINHYFANSYIVEKEFDFKINNLKFAKSNLHLFEGTKEEKKEFLKEVDKSIQLFEDQMYFHISRYMTLKRNEIFWNLAHQKNPIFTFINPYFISKSLQIQISDMIFQSDMRLDIISREHQ